MLLKKKEKVGSVVPSRKGLLPMVKKVAAVVGRISFLVLALPFKLPVKISQMTRYLGIVAGVIQESAKDESSGN